MPVNLNFFCEVFPGGGGNPQSDLWEIGTAVDNYHLIELKSMN